MKLAIIGHATRGKEVIEVLEMLGGKNDTKEPYDGSVYKGRDDIYYYIDENNYIRMALKQYGNVSHFTFITLEEFLEKFHYKVGDKVLYTRGIGTIDSIKWNVVDNEIQYNVIVYGENWLTTAEFLLPYKEQETISIPETMKQITDIAEKLIKIDIPKGYEFVGVDDDKQQVVFEKIGCQYPKTYKECCDVLGLNTMANDAQGYKVDLIIRFQELLIARDAYWKIAGDWKPDWKESSEKYSLVNCGGAVQIDLYRNYSQILSFSTAEMRDAFYENFKDLIEKCKELL